MHYTNTCMFSICSPFIERSLSTVAELAFILQLLKWFNVTIKYKTYCILTITLAEICCWSGIISGFSYLHTIEESIWCGNAIFLLSWLKSSTINKIKSEKFIAMTCLNCYIAYMILYDIPMYINRPNSNKKHFLICENISTDIILWKQSLIWMTGYFTLGSWVSLII